MTSSPDSSQYFLLLVLLFYGFLWSQWPKALNNAIALHTFDDRPNFYDTIILELITMKEYWTENEYNI